MIIDHQSDVIGNDQNLTEVESRTVECEKGVVGSCYAGEVTMPNKERKKKFWHRDSVILLCQLGIIDNSITKKSFSQCTRHVRISY